MDAVKALKMDNNNFVGNFTGDLFTFNYTYSSSPVRSHACSIHISPGLYCLRSVLQWCRPSGPPFKPSTRRSAISTICFLLLLSAGDIESNPGPARKASLPGNLSSKSNRLNSVTFGCYNIQSANRKAALIHDLINDFHIDILALTEINQSINQCITRLGSQANQRRGWMTLNLDSASIRQVKQLRLKSRFKCSYGGSGNSVWLQTVPNSRSSKIKTTRSKVSVGSMFL